MHSPFTSFFKRWQTPIQAHLYTIIEGNSENEVEEQKPVSYILHSARRKWFYIVLLTALWFSTAAILSLVDPTILTRFQRSGRPQ